MTIDRAPTGHAGCHISCPAGNTSRRASASPTDAEPYGCLRDPLLDETRYVYVRAAITTLLTLGRGRRDWAEALDDGTLVISGAPELANRVTEWFTPSAAGASARRG